MEKSVILIKIGELIKQHVNCTNEKHSLVIVDKDLRLIHDERLLSAPCSIAEISREQIDKGLTAKEWARIGGKADRALRKLES